MLFFFYTGDCELTLMISCMCAVIGIRKRKPCCLIVTQSKLNHLEVPDVALTVGEGPVNMWVAQKFWQWIKIIEPLGVSGIISESSLSICYGNKYMYHNCF